MSGKKKGNTDESAGPKPVEPKAVSDYKSSARKGPATNGSAGAPPKTAAAPKSSPAPAAASAAASTSAAAPASAAAPKETLTFAPTPGANKGPKNVVQEVPRYAVAAAAGGPKPSGRGQVRAVLSGDCIVVTTDPKTGAERTLTLSGIQSPRFARSRNSSDEAYGWAAREFLRKKVLEQVVDFTVNFSQEAKGNAPAREYATVKLVNGGENLAEAIVRAGWATVKSGGGVTKEGKPHPEREHLQQLEAAAAKALLGVHNKEGAEDAVRNVEWQPDAAALFAKHRGAPVPAIVDQVKDGSTLRCELIPNPQSPLHHVMINLHLAGVQCPRLPPPIGVKQQKDDDESGAAAQKIQPFAVEAQKSTEDKLLHRDVTVLLQGVDKFNNFFGTVQFHAGNITQFLLSNGLGTLVEWSAKLTGQAEAYAQAARHAQTQRLRLYANASAASAAASAQKSADDKAEYRVVQINSGDTLVLADSREVEHKVSLSSIRAPRVGNAKRGEADEAYAFEAREWLRKKLIGKKVKRTIDYTRPAAREQKDQTPRPFATVRFEGQNMAEQLVSLGLATVIKHRAEDPRASDYEALCIAEAQATEQKKGLHNHLKTPPVHHIIDLSERFGGRGSDDDKSDNRHRSVVAKAKGYLNSLQHVAHAGVVEYVFTGSRLKIFVPKENAIISLALAGIRAPGPKQEGKVDAMGELSLAYTRRNVLQQNVLVEVDDIDKGGNFIGSVFFNSANLAVHLLQEGLAHIYEFSADRCKYADQLYAAEEAAKAAKKGVWKDYDPAAAAKAAAAKDSKADDSIRVFTGGKEFVSVKVTEILTGSHFFVHFADDNAVAKVEDEMAGVSSTSPVPASFAKGSIVSGQFSDGAWHRVRIVSGTPRAADGSGKFDVFFIDFGNSDVLDEDDLRSLPASLSKVPPLAHECHLAGCKAPSASNDYADGAAHALNELIFDKPILAKVHYTDGATLYVSLFEAMTAESINEQLLKAGWLRIPKSVHASVKAFVNDKLQECEQEAKNARPRIRIWSQGDVSDEDEAEKGDWRGELPVKSKKPAAAPKPAPKAAPAKAAAGGSGAGAGSAAAPAKGGNKDQKSAPAAKSKKA